MTRTNKLDQLKDLTEQVKSNAAGQWGRILWTLVPEAIPALQKPGRHVTCPFHGGKGDFRVHRSRFEESGETHCTCGHWDGWSLLMHARGWTFPQAVEEVNAFLGGRGYQPVTPYKAPERPAPSTHTTDEQIQQRMQKWWSEALPLDHAKAKPALRYFRNRKVGEILLPIEDVRLHPELDYYDEKEDGQGMSRRRFPAIVCVVRRPNGKVSTLHRTWITPTGLKAPLPNPRKQYTSPSTSPVQGGAIKLDQRAEIPVLNVAEGLESALAARAISRHPTWSCLNKELLRQVQVPDHVQVVTIWADKDRSRAGEEAAVELMNRLKAEGKSAVVMLPQMPIPEDAKGVDWNNVVHNLGLEASRLHFHVQAWRRGLELKLKELGVAPDDCTI